MNRGSMIKLKEKEKAIKLRKRGFSYSEILKEIPVAKSTLSLWLRSVGLSKRQKQRLTEKKFAAILRGGATKRRQRIERTKQIKRTAKAEIKTISKKELWLMGIMLYWAEGTKEKEYRPGKNVQFMNSDAAMIKLFLRWLFKICKIEKERLVFSIYIHKNSKNNIEKVRDFWSLQTGFTKKYFSHVYFKKHKPKTNRKNIGDTYYGTLRVTVRASSGLNRKIAGWTEKICQINNCGVV